MMTKKTFKLYSHQEKAVKKLRTGSILNGGVGSGKSLVALEYYAKVVPPWKSLYIITTAHKRDTKEWEEECEYFSFESVTVDSWNNIRKYIEVSDSFFIFDEQRVIGSGSWVKSFLKITKNNDWILLTATPGDTWMDYIPVFVANKFYKNRTEFIKRHVIFNRFLKFPKVDQYVEEDRLIRMKKYLTVDMDYEKTIKRFDEDISVDFDKDNLNLVVKKRWNPYLNKPLKTASAMIFVSRQVVNSDPSRLGTLQALLDKHLKIIVFYNFNYELKILRELKKYSDTEVAEYNGYKHEEIPSSDKWVYLVQYLAGNEGWNCIETNTIVFYSLNYSYRIMTQAAGRIDRINTPFDKLYYYYLISNSFIDKAIKSSLQKKKNFNEGRYIKIENLWGDINEKQDDR